jgi:glycosyltransferase involved in cell wall biosynthesis
MKEGPLVSVLITCFNGMPYILKAVNNILNQTYTKLEVIIVDDFSNDNTFEELNEKFNNEPRVHVMLNRRKGRGFALNYGLQLCKGKYVAINDADDFSTPNRIQTQVNFLEQNPDFTLVGSYSLLHFLDTGIKETNSVKRPIDFEEIKNGFTKGQPIQHVTVMFKKEHAIKAGGYNENIKFLFDRDFFLRIVKFGKLYNIPEYLVEVGEHSNRYFKGNFTGIDREWMNTKYQIKAIFQFNINYHLIPTTVFKFIYTILLSLPKLLKK